MTQYNRLAAYSLLFEVVSSCLEFGRTAAQQIQEAVACGTNLYHKQTVAVSTDALGFVDTKNHQVGSVDSLENSSAFENLFADCYAGHIALAVDLQIAGWRKRYMLNSDQYCQHAQIELVVLAEPFVRANSQPMHSTYVAYHMGKLQSLKARMYAAVEAQLSCSTDMPSHLDLEKRIHCLSL